MGSALLVDMSCETVEAINLFGVSIDPTAPFNPLQPTVFGMRCSLRESGRIFRINIRNFKLWKMPKLLNFMFPEG